MKTNQPAIMINDIPAAERTPTVQLLLSVVASLESQLIKQVEQLEVLTLELKRLRKLQEKPKLKASKLPREPDDEPPSATRLSDKTRVE